MFAVVNIAGQQFKVTENTMYYVPRLQEDADNEITFSNVLVFSDDSGATKIGSPFVDGVQVTAKVIGHVQDDKVLVFKKKRRTGYDKLNGHRQKLTRIEITKIG